MLNGRLKGLLLTKLPVVYDLLTKVTLKILKALVGIFNKEKALREVSLTAVALAGHNNSTTLQTADEGS